MRNIELFESLYLQPQSQALCHGLECVVKAQKMFRLSTLKLSSRIGHLGPYHTEKHLSLLLKDNEKGRNSTFCDSLICNKSLKMLGL